MSAVDFNPRTIMVDLHASIDEDVRRWGLKVLQACVLGTPVGNPTLWQQPDSAPPGYVGGHARRNWHVSIATPLDTEFPGVDGTGGETIHAGRAILAEYDESARGVPVHVQNAVPYIGRLNDGHSTQAPAGFVNRAVAAVEADEGRRTEL